MNHQFVFGQFKPSNELVHSSSEMLERILEKAPSDCTPLARLVKRKGGYEATVEIFSRAGYFVAHSLELTPEQAVAVVRDRIEERLAQWKETRFEGAYGYEQTQVNNEKIA